MLRQVARERPSHPAPVSLTSGEDDTPREITYSALLSGTEAIAAQLRAADIQPGESVAVLLPKMPETVAALIATMSTAVAFPVNPLLSAEALATQFTIARTRYVVTGCLADLGVPERLAAAIEMAPQRIDTIHPLCGQRISKNTPSVRRFPHGRRISSRRSTLPAHQEHRWPAREMTAQP
jgi:acyl-CoA synthetase (AMP-forming)/AMP-acid ligase II